jgi:hypothetical protein
MEEEEVTSMAVEPVEYGRLCGRPVEASADRSMLA